MLRSLSTSDIEMFEISMSESNKHKALDIAITQVPDSDIVSDAMSTLLNHRIFITMIFVKNLKNYHLSFYSLPLKNLLLSSQFLLKRLHLFLLHYLLQLDPITEDVRVV